MVILILILIGIFTVVNPMRPEPEAPYTYANLIEDIKNNKNRAVFIFNDKRDDFNILICSFSANSKRLYEMLYLIERNKKYMIAGVLDNVIQ